jgi:DNA repair ATPase RecN
MANKLREKIGMFYDKTKESEGVSVAELKYGNMADWKEVTEKIGTQLDNFKTLFDDIREAIKNSKDIDGADKYLDSVLKTINSGMAGIEKEKYEFQNTLDSEENGKLKELWDLIEQKTDVYRDYSKQYASDEEKYQSFLKQSTQFNGIDSRIDELLSDIY